PNGDLSRPKARRGRRPRMKRTINCSVVVEIDLEKAAKQAKWSGSKRSETDHFTRSHFKLEATSTSPPPAHPRFIPDDADDSPSPAPPLPSQPLIPEHDRPNQKVRSH